MGDDIGYRNISAYNRGMMGYRTLNIDRIANEGAIFTDYYGQQSCTASRAAFITGWGPLRTGLLEVGLPATKEGLSGPRRSPDLRSGMMALCNVTAPPFARFSRSFDFRAFPIWIGAEPAGQKPYRP